MEKTEKKLFLKVQIYKHWLILAEKLYFDSNPSKQTPSISDQRRRLLYGATLFLAFALESFINEIGIEFCPNEFESLDKISTSDKWLIIPRLISKPLFFRDREPFQSIFLIFKYRNFFAHFKPEFKDEKHKDYEDMRKIDHSLIRKFYGNTIIAMQLLRDKLKIKDMEWLDLKKGILK